ncbi:MAG TPA: hypothetical protein DCQ26_12010 [Marinilabiliales bacterium]|nr:MAG: hypothetical protein A2W95_19325 [Bacteroidetes bacterium GWA2_40_14]OFX65068.1 MAG: hypothetical protein A2W84_01095 [Bacteroidetes bacterium GWC2_40_13]OFX74921.1 MAG: hypothetical protein A2W96_10725 [Bacteroidetes bacterium GWD2_40_43]OFX94266.1 MAG: hypothetical protein A2W97_19040 [Bacteroidetes bacterium GWE2_40_63]OFY23665.1 MAG: hypothetical protein A2W88_12800 [Bacteroidetes bacterium GWF2_40_13]OFZ25258.1 MAG: hypothetical protein A2437_07725 [Bacteroidetes bacterium RIFOXYC
MSFGKRFLEICKKKDISRERLNTKGLLMRRYERDETKPGIEAAAKNGVIVDVFCTPLLVLPT